MSTRIYEPSYLKLKKKRVEFFCWITKRNYR